MRATFFNSEGAKINDSLGPPDVQPPGYAPEKYKGQDSKPRTLKKDGQNQTQSRFKDLLEEDSEAESRPDPNHILAFTKTNHQLPASSVTMLCI